jgi:hypothetical protein
MYKRIFVTFGRTSTWIDEVNDDGVVHDVVVIVVSRSSAVVHPECFAGLKLHYSFEYSVLVTSDMTFVTST